MYIYCPSCKIDTVPIKHGGKYLCPHCGRYLGTYHDDVIF